MMQILINKWIVRQKANSWSKTKGLIRDLDQTLLLGKTDQGIVLYQLI